MIWWLNIQIVSNPQPLTCVSFSGKCLFTISLLKNIFNFENIEVRGNKKGEYQTSHLAYWSLAVRKVSWG